MPDKTILFGGSGFFGPIILEKYPDIISVGRTKLPENLKNQHIHITDVDNLSALNNLDFDKVIFLIGNSNHHKINKPENVTMGIDYNLIPLKKTLNYLQEQKIKKEGKKIKKFIAFTGALLYDANKTTLPVDETQALNPYINDYVFSKYLAEELTKCYKEIPIINVRLSNIYGPTRLIRPDIIPTLMQSALSPNEVQVWNTKPERDFVYAKDVADAVIALLNTDYTGPVNVGSGKMNSVARVVKIIEKLSGKKIKVLNKDVSGPMKYVHDISLLKKLTGWKPRYTLEQGLTETYKNMKKYANECKWWEQTSDKP